MLSAIGMSTSDELPGPEGLRTGSIARATATGTSTSQGTFEASVAVDAGGPRQSIGGAAIISVRPASRVQCPASLASRLAASSLSSRRQHLRWRLVSSLPLADGGIGRTAAGARLVPPFSGFDPALAAGARQWAGTE